MGYVKLSLLNGDLLTTRCTMAFVKHIDSDLCRPEQLLNEKLNGELESFYKLGSKRKFDVLPTNGLLPYQSLYILNFYEEDLPFSYPSLDSYARRMIRYSLKSRAMSIATVIHGPSGGIDALRAMETLLSTFRREFVLRNGDLGSLQEIILVEKDKTVFAHLQDYVNYILKNKNYIIQIGKDLFINPAIDETAGYEVKQHSPLNYVFVAMPYQETLNNIYHYGIKGAIEKRQLVCERLDKELFTGDIVQRIKSRIENATFLIADITGDSPNVFYEVGYADGLKKDVVLISQKESIPFDICTRNCIFYQPDDIPALETSLGKQIDYLMKSKTVGNDLL